MRTDVIQHEKVFETKAAGDQLQYFLTVIQCAVVLQVNIIHCEYC